MDCHEGESAKAGLDLSALRFEPDDARNFDTWVKVHDRVRDGEMPPAKRDRPPRAQARAFVKSLSASLVTADRAREEAEGRAAQRRLNRYEYENTLRDLLEAPWLEIKELLPEDGEAHRFNKVGEALDVSHVQLAQYLAAAEYALREVMATDAARPETKTVRYWARDMRGLIVRNLPERSTFPVLAFEGQPQGQPDVRARKAPWTVGPDDPARREREAVGVAASTYEPLEPSFSGFRAPRTGRYRLRLSAYSIWVGPSAGEKWWTPDLDTVSRGRGPEPITLYAQRRTHQLRRLGSFDVTADPNVGELDVLLYADETIRPDPARLFRSRPPNWRNPLATKEGQPGVAYKWLEVEGPLIDDWPPAGHRLLFGELAPGATPADPEADAERLVRAFMARAYRRPITEAEVALYLGVVHKALAAGMPFADAVITGDSAVLCSPGFVLLEEAPGRLDNRALATRLAYFLWNSAPDEKLRGLAERGDLARPEVLRGEIERLLDDPRSRRFVDAFLDYWLDLRRVNATSPDAGLYPDYYLDDLLTESADEEPRLFFAELLGRNLPARNLVSSSFALINERLAAHYGLRSIAGVGLRRVPLPAGHVRGGVMTMAGVLKVTANGTTTSPVVRGAWIMERMLGQPPPPPPPSVPTVEPDIRGASTIRQQLDKHRTQKSCAACHAKIDPVGFALENFDVFGGWRDRYRGLGGAGERVEGIGKNGQAFEFRAAQPVDASGILPGAGARKFRNVVELKRLLLRNERQIARNLTKQLVVYATGAPVRFGDRDRVEAILDRAAPSGYGVRAIVREIVASELFQRR